MTDLDTDANEGAPATRALRAVLADVFNEHDYNSDGKVNFVCLCVCLCGPVSVHVRMRVCACLRVCMHA